MDDDDIQPPPLEPDSDDPDSDDDRRKKKERKADSDDDGGGKRENKKKKKKKDSNDSSAAAAARTSHRKRKVLDSASSSSEEEEDVIDDEKNDAHSQAPMDSAAKPKKINPALGAASAAKVNNKGYGSVKQGGFAPDEVSADKPHVLTLEEAADYLKQFGIHIKDLTEDNKQPGSATLEKYNIHIKFLRCEPNVVVDQYNVNTPSLPKLKRPLPSILFPFSGFSVRGGKHTFSSNETLSDVEASRDALSCFTVLGGNHTVSSSMFLQS